VEVEGVVADSPSDGTFLCGSSTLICLTFDAEIHDVIPTNGAVVNNDIPSPQSDGVPLLDFKSLLGITTFCCARLGGFGRGL